LYALSYLEAEARNRARKAVEAEKKGDYQEAMTQLRKAIDALETLVRHYRDHPLARIYAEWLVHYRRKYRYLEAKLLPASEEVYRAEIIREESGEEEPPEFVLKEKPDVRFQDIAGLEHAKRAIREAIIYPIRRPDLYPLGWPRGILLFGPPGTGKTMLAAAVANEVDAEFLYVGAANIMSKWLGEGEKNVKKLFSYARRKAQEGTPVIIFIDEIDELLGVHSTEVGGEVRVRNQFLKEMDGIQDKGKKIHVYVVGATNKPWKLDDGFIRRFQKRIYVPLPDKEARKALLRMLLSKMRVSRDVDIDRLADMTQGYSGSDIASMIQDINSRKVSEMFEKGLNDPEPITMKDFIEAIKSRKPSVDERMIKLIEEWAKKYGAT